MEGSLSSPALPGALPRNTGTIFAHHTTRISGPERTTDFGSVLLGKRLIVAIEGVGRATETDRVFRRALERRRELDQHFAAALDRDDRASATLADAGGERMLAGEPLGRDFREDIRL